MGNIRIERVPIQGDGIVRIRADHLMLVYQQDPLDYGEFQDRWWVMEGTRDINPDGTVTSASRGLTESRRSPKLMEGSLLKKYLIP